MVIKEREISLTLIPSPEVCLNEAAGRACLQSRSTCQGSADPTDPQGASGRHVVLPVALGFLTPEKSRTIDRTVEARVFFSIKMKGK